MSTSTPKVSIIVPNYNHARFLPQRLNSILRQTFQDFELILLDDSSTDDSRSILWQYGRDPRVRIEFNEVNSTSVFKQWNKGVRLARGEYVWIAESDDYADERLLQRLTARLDAEPRAALAYCRSWRVVHDRVDGFVDPLLPGREPDRWTTDYCEDGHEECCNYLVRCNTVPNASAVVFRKMAYHRVGGADESLYLCGDWKLWAAIALTGKIVYVAEPLNYFRFHEATVRSLCKHSDEETFRVQWWIVENATRPEFHKSDERAKLALANCWMHLAFQNYPDFPDITRVAVQRVRELGFKRYIPPFGTVRGQFLRRVIGWKATKRMSMLSHRCSAWVRNALAETVESSERWLHLRRRRTSAPNLDTSN
ncbi:MAG: glycosyltransferase family A protein [Candidatus Sulfotelmatobacter sp.]